VPAAIIEGTIASPSSRREIDAIASRDDHEGSKWQEEPAKVHYKPLEHRQTQLMHVLAADQRHGVTGDAGDDELDQQPQPTGKPLCDCFVT